MADFKPYEKSAEAEENLTRDSSRTGDAPAAEPEPIKETLKQRTWRNLKTPGSALQIILAALLAVAIGLAVSITTPEIPEAAPAILQLPGTLWLRALRATGLCFDTSPVFRRLMHHSPTTHHYCHHLSR